MTLQSALAQSYPAVEVIVVDNQSADGTAGLIATEFPSVQLIVNQENLGFCRANNLGFQVAQGDYILCLNPDVWLSADFVTRLVEALEREPQAGIASGKLYSTPGLTPEDLAQAESQRRLDSTGLVLPGDCRALDRGQGEVDRGQYDGPGRIFGACGAAAVYRTAMLKAVGYGQEYFDEHFFAYKEDVDLAWRAQHVGWVCVYEPSAIGYHVRGWKARGRRTVPRVTRVHSLKNQYLMLVKNLPMRPISRVLRVAVHELLVIAYFTFFEPFLWEAVREAWHLRRPMLERRQHTVSTPKR